LEKFILSVLQATPLPNDVIAYRVTAETFPIFIIEVACAVVGAGSIKTTFQAERVSQAG